MGLVGYFLLGLSGKIPFLIEFMKKTIYNSPITISGVFFCLKTVIQGTSSGSSGDNLEQDDFEGSAPARLYV